MEATGAATPYSLYKLYNKQAAANANPFTPRQMGKFAKRGRTSAVGTSRSVQRLHSATAGPAAAWDDPSL